MTHSQDKGDAKNAVAYDTERQTDALEIRLTS